MSKAYALILGIFLFPNFMVFKCTSTSLKLWHQKLICSSLDFLELQAHTNQLISCLQRAPGYLITITYHNFNL